MEKRLKCLTRQRKKCSHSVERTSDVCEYCGHRRCETCKPDLWPNLADGCCSCLARLLKRANWRVISTSADDLHGE
jgi:hypothetical protein